MTIDERLIYLEWLAKDIDQRLKILEELNERDHDNIWETVKKHSERLEDIINIISEHRKIMGMIILTQKSMIEHGMKDKTK